MTSRTESLNHGHVPWRSLPTISREKADTRSTALDRWALARIQHGVARAPIRFTLWDGYTLPADSADVVATILIRNRSALLRWLWDPDLNFGEAFMFGAVEVQGDLVAMLEAVYRSQAAMAQPHHTRARANNVHTARENVHHHYDLGNAFYERWLDSEMQYTCAFFPTPDAMLEDAQIAKMDRVCRKLRLHPGERVIEAGCGWGSFALFMAERYGVSVRAFNISSAQIAWAREQAVARGLQDRVEFIEDDYRNLQGPCDVFVSVGMLEHVGRADFPTFAQVIARALTAEGRGLLHFIGRDRPAPLNAWIRKRIFPGAYPPTLGEVVDDILEPAQLSVLDVENLRLHYAKTLEHWRRRFEMHARDITQMFDENFVRAWRLYLAGSQASFSTGWMQLFQVLFSRSGSNAIPWSRDRPRA